MDMQMIVELERELAIAVDLTPRERKLMEALLWLLEEYVDTEGDEKW